ATSSDLSMVKKLVHNASERDRRKKINNLYSSLRSLLPLSDQMTFEGRVFYNLHYQVDKTRRLESDILNEKILSIMEK
ncbi:hypothetical protein RYX36_017945, partial [Vicia faba]